MALHLSKAAKAVVAGVSLAASTAVGFLPHNDIWFNILTGVLAIAGTYGVYQWPNKTVTDAETAVKDVVTSIKDHAPLASVAPEVAAVVADVSADMVTNPVDPAPVPVPNLAAPITGPSPIPPTTTPGV